MVVRVRVEFDHLNEAFNVLDRLSQVLQLLNVGISELLVLIRLPHNHVHHFFSVDGQIDWLRENLVPFRVSFLANEILRMLLYGDIFDQAAEHVLEQVLLFRFGQVLRRLALVLNLDKHKFNEGLTLLLGMDSNVSQLALRDIDVFVLILSELLLEDSSFEVDRRDHVLDNCLSILRFLEDFVSCLEVVLLGEF